MRRRKARIPGGAREPPRGGAHDHPRKGAPGAKAMKGGMWARGRRNSDLMSHSAIAALTHSVSIA